MRVLFIDTETTGLSPGLDRLIEVGGVLHDVDVDNTSAGGGAAELAAFSLVINPQGPVPAAVTTLTGLRSDHVSRGLSERTALSLTFSAMADSDVVMAWNASFDRTMLEAAAARTSLPMPPTPWRCALQVARGAHPEWPRHRLGDALKALKLHEHENSHRALGDARAAFAVWWAITSATSTTSATSSTSAASSTSTPRLPIWRRLFA
jgi:DNA polymerase-3 subunit epsilon